MKTTDLIPFILLELKEHDKYGFELTKAIETKSNGNIIIKQPTLYTILKKLEKSKFIASYWEDSEIGGKRHYYKITNNGLKQTETLPSYEELLKAVCGSDFVIPKQEQPTIKIEQSIQEQPSFKNEIISEEQKETEHIPQPKKEENVFSIFDHLTPNTNEAVEETILPSEEVFSSTTLDNSTELEINRNNTDLLKQGTQHVEEFANSANVAKFTKNISSDAPKISTEIPTNVIKDEEFNNFDINTLPEMKSCPSTSAEIPYVEYEEIRKSESYIYSKTTAKKLLARMTFNCLYLLAMLITCYVVTSFVGRSNMFYILLIASIISLVFIPAVFISNYKNIKIKLQQNKLKIELKKKLIMYVSVILLVIMLCMVISILLGKNSVGLMFSINNFANMYMPIILSSTLFFDLIIIKILFFKNK